MVRTISVKIHPGAQYLRLLESCAELFNHYTGVAYKSKTYNKSKIHKETYHDCVQRFPLIKTALIQSVRDNALECCKRSKLKGKPPVKKKHSGIRLDRRSLAIRGEQITIIGIDKRHKEIISVPEIYKEMFYTWKQSGATLTYDKFKKQFWLNISFHKEDPPTFDGKEVLGIDRGLYNIVTLSNGTNYKGNKVRKLKRKYLYNRKQLQQKGTRSAKRKLRALSGKEKRFMKDVNHVISKEIANLPYGKFVLEDLTGIRRQSRKSKKLNKWISDWTFFQLETFLKYKAEAKGKQIAHVSARYTSKKCSCCGQIGSSSRYKSRFVCKSCGFTAHADVNAANNIKNNHILFIPEMTMKQAAVNQPNVTSFSGLVASPAVYPLGS